MTKSAEAEWPSSNVFDRLFGKHGVAVREASLTAPPTRTSTIIVRIVLSNIAALTLALLLKRVLPPHSKEVPAEVWGIFFGVLGVIFAILVGFILAELLTRFHRLSAHIHDELNAVQDIRDYLIYVNENMDTKARIRSALHIYVGSIVDREWAAMTVADASDSDTSEELYDLMRAVEDLEMFDESDVVALEAIIHRIGDVTTFRTERLEMSKQHLSPSLRGLIVFMSLILVIGFVLMSVPDPWTHGFIVISAVTSIHLLYLIISDLNHPYYGAWNITGEQFVKVRDRLASAGERGSAPVVPFHR